MDDKSGDDLSFLVHEALARVFMFFYNKSASSSSIVSGNEGGNRLSVDNIDDLARSCDSLEAEFKKQLELENKGKGTKSEMEQYLEDPCMVGDCKFDILTWWKLNACRYPIVSEMAKQVLAVPVTTVTSESCFSTGDRVLDVFRSSLSPEHAEALICCQNWIKGAMVEHKYAHKEEQDAHKESIATIEGLGIDLAAKVTIDSVQVNSNIPGKVLRHIDQVFNLHDQAFGAYEQPWNISA